jgi:hypothetical protein
MFPKWHILFGFVAFFILVYFFKFSLLAGLTIFLASFLIDVDHYFYYVYIKKDRSPINSYHWFVKRIILWKALSIKQRKNFKHPVMIFHGIEFWIILFLLSYLNPIFLWILIGIGIHILADFADMIVEKEPIYLKISSIISYLKEKSKSKKYLS